MTDEMRERARKRLESMKSEHASVLEHSLDFEQVVQLCAMNAREELRSAARDLERAKEYIWHQIYRNHPYSETCSACRGAALFAAPAPEVKGLERRGQ